MTTVHPDLAALLAAVRRSPNDDTPRLVLADWLDEHEQHERAEFIRVQCVHLPAAERDYDDCLMRDLHYTDPEKANASAELKRLRARERELLTDARRREWSDIKCPVCGGATVAEHSADGWSSLEQCDFCTGTGASPVEFRRGFVESVTCRMGDVLREESCPHITGGNCRCNRTGVVSVLTDWARGVPRAHPVTRWEIVDREPWNLEGGRWRYWCDGEPRESAIPALVFHEMQAAHPAKGVWYDSPELARDALALAVGRVARRLAGLPEVTP